VVGVESLGLFFLWCTDSGVSPATLWHLPTGPPEPPSLVAAGSAPAKPSASLRRDLPFPGTLLLASSILSIDGQVAHPHQETLSASPSADPLPEPSKRFCLLPCSTWACQCSEERSRAIYKGVPGCNLSDYTGAIWFMGDFRDHGSSHSNSCLTSFLVGVPQVARKML
jgi:hypothetical protein